MTLQKQAFRRMARLMTGTGLVAGSLLVGAPAGQAAAGPGPAAPAAIAATATPAADPCDPDVRVSATARVDQELTAAFNRYGNAGNGFDHWSGGDSTYSAALSGGRTAWIFSDTFLGSAAADGSRPRSSPFINNSIVVQQPSPTGDRWRTVHGGTPNRPEAILPPSSKDSWYWFGAAQPGDGGRTLSVVALRFERFGPGYWDWRWASNHLLRLDTTRWTAQPLRDLPSAANVQWSAWLQPLGDDLLVYGVEDLGAEKYLHLAKVAGGDLAAVDRWQYWTGTGWSRSEAESARILDHVANEMSVTPWRGGYLAVTQDTAVPFDNAIRGYFSCRPEGPFTDLGVLHRMPETGAGGTYSDPTVFGYNAHVHPALSSGDELLLTYNVNSLSESLLYADVSVYRPRFVRLSLHVG